MATWTPQETERLRVFVTEGKSWQEIAKEMGRSVDACSRRWGRVASNIVAQVATEGDIPAERFEFSDAGDSAAINSVSRSIRTVEDAIKRAEIDLRVWEVYKTKVNSWEVAGKRNLGQDEDHRWKGEELWSQTLWQITIELRRKAPKAIQRGVADLVVDLRERPIKLPKLQRKKADDPHMLELVLFDAHFGKRCWGQEVGGADYDLAIAEDVFVNAVNELMDRVHGFAIEKIVLPIGQDFFQMDNVHNETAHGTVVDSVDDRLSLVFRTGCRAVMKAITRCRQRADVEVLWVPGNHDTTTSWFLCEVLDAFYHADDHVIVDSGPTHRKYRHYGTSLLAYTHGYDEKMRDLPLVMATEQPELWAKTTCRHWRCGHWHKKAQYQFTAGDTYNGVKVDILPSLSGTDAWHYRKGFVGNARTAEAYLWSRSGGYVGHFSTAAIF